MRQGDFVKEAWVTGAMAKTALAHEERDRVEDADHEVARITERSQET